MPQTGEKPGVGNWTCNECEKSVELKTAQEALPVCPWCGNKTYRIKPSRKNRKQAPDQCPKTSR